MCGIFGYFGNQAIDSAAVLESLRRRGPDGEGIARMPLQDDGVSTTCTLIHTRLAIIDLTHTADQPMVDSSGRHTIIFNGEIFNYRELREDLRTLGHRFTTQSDTEVLLAAYLEWGADVVQRVQGMFAFAVVDRTDGSLFLARDPFGIKPLYYLTDGTDFAFASNLSALFAARIGTTFHLDSDAIRRFLAFGAFVAPDTIVSEIKALPPGHILRRNKDNVSVEQYYSPADPVELRDADTEEIMAGMRDTLFASVKRHLVSDVPVGIFLSGGIDSTLIASIAAKITHEPVRTFTVGYRDSHGMHDETEIAAHTASRIGADHENVLLDDADFESTLDDFLAAIDMPSGDGLNSYFVSRAIGNKAKVILSGLGGDEIFCGYPYFRHLHDRDEATGLDRLASYLPERVLHRLGKANLVHHRDSRDEMLLKTRMRGRHAETARGRFRDFLHPGQSDLVAASVLEIASYLPNQLLRDVDAVAMHHSLEVRVPFVDRQVVSYAMSVPDRFKMLPHINKALLVSPFFDLLPMETYQGVSKRGFELPMNAWLFTYLTTDRRQELAALADEWGLTPLDPILGHPTNPKRFARELPFISRWLVLLKWIEANGARLAPATSARSTPVREYQARSAA